MIGPGFGLDRTGLLLFVDGQVDACLLEYPRVPIR